MIWMVIGIIAFAILMILASTCKNYKNDDYFMGE